MFWVISWKRGAAAPRASARDRPARGGPGSAAPPGPARAAAGTTTTNRPARAGSAASVARAMTFEAQTAPASVPRNVGMPLARLTPAPVRTSVGPPDCRASTSWLIEPAGGHRWKSPRWYCVSDDRSLVCADGRTSRSRCRRDRLVRLAAHRRVPQEPPHRGRGAGRPRRRSRPRHAREERAVGRRRPRVDALRGPARGRRHPHHRHRHAERSARRAGRGRGPRRQAHPAREADRAERRRADRASATRCAPPASAPSCRSSCATTRGCASSTGCASAAASAASTSRARITCRASPTGIPAGSGAAPSRAAAATCSPPAATRSTRCAGHGPRDRRSVGVPHAGHAGLRVADDDRRQRPLRGRRARTRDEHDRLPDALHLRHRGDGRLRVHSRHAILLEGRGRSRSTSCARPTRSPT